VQQPAKAK